MCRRRAAGTALLGLVTARHGRLRADYQTFRFLSKRTIRLSEAGWRRRRRDLCLQHCDHVAAKQKGPWSGENSELTSRVIIRANCAQLCISMFIEICPSSHAYISCVRRLAARSTRCTNRLNPRNNIGIRNVPLPSAGRGTFNLELEASAVPHQRQRRHVAPSISSYARSRHGTGVEGHTPVSR